VTDWHHPSYVVLQDPSIYSDVGAFPARPRDYAELQPSVYSKGCADVPAALSVPPAIEHATPSVKVSPTGRLKVPLGEVTNIINGDSRHQDASKKPVKFTPSLYPDVALSRPEFPAPRKTELDTFGRDMDDIWVDQNSPRESKQGSESGSSASTVPRVFDAGAHAGLPSLGSVQHATGDCRRCNFFAKGRCRNGLNCQFCHFEHSRPKMSRQEKRELHASRQIDSELDEIHQLANHIPPPPGLFSPYMEPEVSRNSVVQSTVGTQTDTFACSRCLRLGSDRRR
jgi:hypothetical protein